jgi:hypothetical protein
VSRVRLLALGTALAACVTPAAQRRDDFGRVAREFNDHIRWGRWAIAAQSLPPDEARLFLERVKLAGPELELGDQDTTSIQLTGEETATVTVKFDWYSKREMIVRSSTIEQRWKVQDGRWKVIDQRRVAGDRFPLVPERKDADAGP